MIIKICGLRTIEPLLAAANAGADWVGLVFAPSRRQVRADQAASLVAALRYSPAGQRVKLVGLFVNEDSGQINAIAEHCGLDYVQLSGTESLQQAAAINRPIIKALRLDGSAEEAEWISHSLQPAVGSLQTAELPTANAPLLLIDAHVPGSYGGTGTVADWDRAAELARRTPLLLAGGLTPENVAEAIARVQPWGVDVSSGVEVQGTKDPARIEAFIGAVRRLA
ncbi:MAG: phosphoribosylanthranilate isomerase [Chloroflexaceae bacterium]|jgi:phosphoribosylanthranilate isomerase|nr:phosphoribosylanthranilate isomerase [Chloroflexaceae bacterium]